MTLCCCLLPFTLKGADKEDMKWFTDAKFGMFIHWGLYSQTAGDWKGHPTKGGEHFMLYERIPVKEYALIANDFNPTEFNARKWVKTAKEAGMKYIVITSKHHDGFAMYHSACSDYNIVTRTPFARDPMKELADECHKQGGLKEAELKSLILEQYQAAGIAPESVDSGAIIITGESAKTRNARPAVMALSQSLGDFVVASAGPHLESVIAGHGAGAQTLSEQRLCRVLNIDIGGGTANYALFDAGKISGTACLNVGGRLLETDSQGRVVYAHKPGQMIVDECFGAGTDARSLTGAQLVQVTRRMAALIVEVIDGTLSPLAQALMQTGLLPAGVTPEIITLSGGVGECYRHQPADPFCFADIGPLLATALHDHPRLREMNVQFPAQTVRATVIGAGAHTLSLSGSTIWLEGVQLPLRNLPVAIPIDETDLVGAWQQALIQLDLDPKTDAYVLALPASLPVRYAAVLTVINALVDFVARFPNPHPLLVVAGQDFGKALGMLLRPQLQQLPLAVIDEVIVRAGDYIDIGTPLFGGSVVPVTVKSLAFPS